MPVGAGPPVGIEPSLGKTPVGSAPPVGAEPSLGKTPVASAPVGRTPDASPGKVSRVRDDVG